MARKHRLGVDCKLYYRSSGSWGTPTWTEVNTVGDCQLTPGWDKADLPLRLTRVKLAVKTMSSISVTGKMLDNGSTAFLAFDAASADDTNLDVLVLNGPRTKAKSRGFRFQAQVFKWDEGQNAGDTLMRDFELAPTLPETLTELPQRAVVGDDNVLVLTSYAATEVDS